MSTITKYRKKGDLYLDTNQADINQIDTNQSNINQLNIEKINTDQITSIEDNRQSISPKQQIADIKKEEALIGDLNRMSQKYKRYQRENNNNNDECADLIKEKDFIINDLKKEIDELKQKNIDITVLYNTKIENIKFENKKELHRLHSEFANRLNK